MRLIAVLTFTLLPATQILALDLQGLRQHAQVAEKTIKSAVLTRLRSETMSILPSTDLSNLSKILEANRSWSGVETVTIDFEMRRWRLNRVDDRDLGSILKDFDSSIGPHDISETVTVVVGDKDYFVSFHPDAQALAIMPVPGGGRPPYPIATGVIPVQALTESTDIKIEPMKPERPPLHRIDVHSASCQATYYTDPEIGHRYRTAEFRTPAGVLVSKQRLSDYRTIDRIPYPFVCVEQKFDSTGRLVAESTFTTKEARFNVVVSEKDFSLLVPESTSVSLFAGSDKKVFTTKQDITIGLDSALRIWNIFTGQAE